MARTRITRTPEYFIEELPDGRWAVSSLKGKIVAYEINADLAKRTAIRLAEMNTNRFFCSNYRGDAKAQYRRFVAAQAEASPKKRRTGS